MKLWKIFRVEFGYQVSSIPTWLYLGVLVGFTLLMNLITTPGDGVYANNTHYITGIVVIGGFIWLIMSAVIAGEAAARDVQTRMHPLTYTAPVTKFTYLCGRFLAAFTINTLLILALPLGILLSFYLPGGEQELLPFRASAYVSVFLLISLPNVFVATALQFTFASLSRQVMTSYLASLGLLVSAQLLGMSAANLFGNWDLVKLLDPVGLVSIVGGELETWTPTEKNTRLISLNGMFLWNRILWTVVAAGSLLLTYARFNFTHPVPKNWLRRFKRTHITLPEAPLRSTTIAVPFIHRTFDFSTGFQQTLTIAWASFIKIARNPVGLTLVGAIALILSVFGYAIITQFGIPLVPTTLNVLEYFIAPVGNVKTPWVVIPLLIMYFSGELIWSEREARLGDIADALPIPEWALLTGKFLGLCLISIVWMALLTFGGILMQLQLGYTNIETSLYIQAFFGLQLTDYLLFAMLALVVHAIVNHKYIGYLMIFLIFIFMAFPSTFNVEHPMLIFGADPGWWYTDMRGFGPTRWPWLWFKIYWIGWALLLAVAARVLWTRGREQNFTYRLKKAQLNLTRLTTWIAILASLLILSAGSFIYYNTNVLNEYLTRADITERKAEYELHYGRYRNIPQPQLTATRLHVEIYPNQQQLDIQAMYTLVNRDTISIDSIHIGSISGITPSQVTFDRPAAGVLIDNNLSHHIYELEHPLQPGDSLHLNFIVHYQQHGFRHNSQDALVVENGTYFTNFDLLPAIGYQPYRELNDPVVRKKYGLNARPAIPSLYDPEARKKPMSWDHNTFEAIVGTSKNEVAVAPGTVYRTWTKGNRSYFHFKTSKSIRGEYSFLSARYRVLENKWNDVAIRIYYYPDHAINTDRMLKSVKASMAYYTKQFGPYPYSHLTIVERAGNTGGASSEASMIDYGEQYSLMTPDDSPNGFDLPYYIMAHEVAHQWFGGAQLSPAHVEGAGVLIEGLAVYCGMQVLKETYGEGHLRQYVSFLHSFYEMPRSLATNSLLQANESFLYYRKGGLAMYVLSEYIGKERVNEALKNLLQKHQSGKIPLPTTLDLYHEIRQVTPDSLTYLLQDLFENNTYWRLKTKQFTVAQTTAGNWEATLKIEAHKVIVDSTGAEKEVAMSDWLEIGIFEKDKRPDEPLYLRMHRIRSGEQIIKVTVPRKPDGGGVDPNHLTIDLRQDDNIIQLNE